MKKALIGSICLVLLLSMAACGNDQNEQLESKHTEDLHSHIPTTSAVEKGVTQKSISLEISYPARRILSANYNELSKTILVHDKDGKELQTISVASNEMFAKSFAYIQDVNFDGNSDLLIPYENPASAIYFQAYLWDVDEEKFIESASFSNLPNYAIDTDNQRILSRRTASCITSYGIHVYDKEKKEFVKTHALYWEPKDENQNKLHLEESIYDEKGIETKVYCVDVPSKNLFDLEDSNPAVKQYFEKGSLWDLNSSKWISSFKKENLN